MTPEEQRVLDAARDWAKARQAFVDATLKEMGVGPLVERLASAECELRDAVNGL